MTLLTLLDDPVEEPAPPEPEVSPTLMAAEVYADLEPIAGQDEANGFPLRALVRAVASMFSQVEEAVRAREGQPAWSQTLNVQRTPAFLLAFLGQFVGVDVTPGRTVTEQRSQIEEEGGWHRQLVSSLKAQIATTLTGTKRVYIGERYEGFAFRMLVVTRPAETPNPTETQAVARAAAPIGVKLVFEESSLPLFVEATLLASEVPETAAEATLEDVT